MILPALVRSILQPIGRDDANGTAPVVWDRSPTVEPLWSLD